MRQAKKNREHVSGERKKQREKGKLRKTEHVSGERVLILQ